MATYSTLMIVHDENVHDFTARNYHRFEFEAEDSTEAKKKLLAGCRKRLKDIKVRRGKFVQIQCLLRFKTKRVLNGAKMLRNRDKFDTISSIMRVSAKRLFVEGYGPKALKELAR